MSGWPNLNFPQVEFDCHSSDTVGRCKVLGYWKSFQNKLAKKHIATSGAPANSLIEARAQTDPSNPPLAKLVVAIASRALFDLDESHQIFESQGTEAYARYQIEHEEIPLAPGVAFPLVCKLLALNTDGHHRVEVTLISRNSADTGLRIFNSIRHHGLDITRAAFTRGESPYRYIEAFGTHLFLSASQEDVEKALDAGIAAATIMPSASGSDASGQLRIAFDGDAVLFSDEAERVFAESGLEAFNRNEREAKDRPLPGGPFKPFLAALHSIQSEFDPDNSPIRTALVTARGAPAHERVIRTLRSWGIRIDEALFLGGMDKGIFLKSFGADIFFDDQRKHCESASGYVATGHVPYGVKNT
jgi:5'-nucleotidase